MSSVRVNAILVTLVLAHNVEGGFSFIFKRNARPEKVEIKYFYEVLCPHSVKFQTKILAPLVKEFRNVLILKPVPFGLARLSFVNGRLRVQCQHGERECYGNKLNACAMYVLGDTSEAVLFNACMMDVAGDGTYDRAAEKCGRTMNINPVPIQDCARSATGDTLLRNFGTESNKVGLRYVPYVMVNGESLLDHNHLRQKVCHTFRSPPPSCYFVNSVLPLHKT